MVEEIRGARDATPKPATDNPDALAASHKRCITASASMTHSDAHVDESRKAIDRSRALLLRAAGGTRLG